MGTPKLLYDVPPLSTKQVPIGHQVGVLDMEMSDILDLAIGEDAWKRAGGPGRVKAKANTLKQGSIHPLLPPNPPPKVPIKALVTILVWMRCKMPLLRRSVQSF